MRRRELILMLGGAMTAWPLAARAQQKAMPVIGVLSPLSSSDSAAPGMAAFRQGMSETGYVEGRNLRIEYRGAEGLFDQLPVLAADLVERRVDVILSTGGLPGARAAKNATATIPIVFVVGVDPVETGLVDGLARPGGNLTGFTIFGRHLGAKRLELLSELVPQAQVIGDLTNPANPGFASSAERLPEDMREVARTKGVQLRLLKASNEGEIDAAFASLVEFQAGGLLVGPDPLFYKQRDQIVALAARHGIPAIYISREFTDSGGLISYGPSGGTGILREAGIYAGRILNGEKPGDLPVQQPTKFELVVNLKTAKALGLTVPQSILVRADEVVE